MVKKAERGEVDSDQDVEGDDANGTPDQSKDVSQSNAVASSPTSDQEYVDEEKFTTVTIEPMVAGGDGFAEATSPAGTGAKDQSLGTSKQQKRAWTKAKPDTKKVKKKKFRYESKSERKATKLHQRAKNAKAAQARRDKG